MEKQRKTARVGVVIIDGKVGCETDWLDAFGVSWRLLPFGDLMHPARWQDLSLVCLPEQVRLDLVTLTNLATFFEQGGAIYAEGCRLADPPHEKIFKKIFGLVPSNDVLSATHERLLSRSTKHPLLHGWKPGTIMDAFENSFLKVEPCGGVALLHVGHFPGTYRAKAPKESFPALMAHQAGRGRSVYATFPFGGFLSRGFVPSLRWEEMARRILDFLGCAPKKQMVMPRAHATGFSYATAWVSTSQIKNKEQRTRCYRNAIRRNVEWFEKSGVLVKPDGSEGVYEAVDAHTGRLRYWLRTDCNVQSAFAFYLAGKLLRRPVLLKRSHRIWEYLLRNNYQDTRSRSLTRGFWTWSQPPQNQKFQIWVDDNSWAALVSFWFYRLTGEDAFRKRGMATIDAFLRFRHQKNGLHWASFSSNEVQRRGVDYFTKRPIPKGDYYSASTHFAGGIISSMAWAFSMTGERKYLDGAAEICRHVLTHVPRYQDVYYFSHTQADARLLLPLAILCRLHPSGKWEKPLNATIQRLASYLTPCGALQERHPLKKLPSTIDIPSVTRDGEPICDLLYSMNFALFNLWFTHGLTGHKDALSLFRRMADFLCRIQINSSNPRIHGGWARSFDYQAGEYYGSNADRGWGPYVMETGWTNSIITGALTMHELNFDVQTLLGSEKRI